MNRLSFLSIRIKVQRSHSNHVNEAPQDLFSCKDNKEYHGEISESQLFAYWGFACFFIVC